ncbi:hypothetical protein HG530_013906 [Fusarium avenaceum]|nr:hypothetical protein HG530_013906 [Fusarium avenaceum]
MEDAVTELLSAMPVLGMQELLDSDATSLDGKQREVNPGRTTIFAKFAKNGKVKDTQMLIAHVLEVSCVLILEKLEESLIKRDEKLRAFVLEPEAAQLGSALKNDLKISLMFDHAAVLLVEKRLKDDCGHDLGVDVQLESKVNRRHSSSEDYEMAELAEYFVTFLDETDADVDRRQSNCNLEKRRRDLASCDNFRDVNLKELHHLEVVLLGVEGVVQLDHVLELLQCLLVPASQGDLEMLVGLDANLNSPVDRNIDMPIFLPSGGDNGHIQPGKTLLDRGHGSLGDNGGRSLGCGYFLDHLLVDSYRFVYMTLMFLAHLGKRDQGQDVAARLATTDSLNDFLVLDGDVVEDGIFNLDVDFKNNSDNLKIVDVRILVSDELAMMGEEVQRLDGQVMGVAEIFLIPLQNLDIDLDHLLMSVMLLVELDQNCERLLQQFILEGARSQTGVIDAEVNRLGLLKMALTVVALGKSASHMDTFTSRMLAKCDGSFSAQDGLPVLESDLDLGNVHLDAGVDSTGDGNATPDADKKPLGQILLATSVVRPGKLDHHGDAKVIVDIKFFSCLKDELLKLTDALFGLFAFEDDVQSAKEGTDASSLGRLLAITNDNNLIKLLVDDGCSPLFMDADIELGKFLMPANDFIT